MNKKITILTLGIQVVLTFIAIFCIYMFFAMLDCDFGFDGFFGLLFFQPIIAALISGLTIFVCLIIGLPIRLNKKLHNWWSTNYFISIIGLVLGLTFLLVAILPIFKETVIYNLDNQQTIKQIPNIFFSISGWFLTAFSMLHFYPSLIKKRFL